MPKRKASLATSAKRFGPLALIALLACDPGRLPAAPEQHSVLACVSSPRAAAVQVDTSAGATGGIWIDRATLAQLPTWGPAWEPVAAAGGLPCEEVSLTAHASLINVCTMAKSLVYVATGDEGCLSDVVAATRAIVATPAPFLERAFVLGQNLPGYVIAADLVDLRSHEPTLDADFRIKLRELLTTQTFAGPQHLVECHETRPNNWGTHCGAARAAVAAYLGDTTELARTARVLRSWLDVESDPGTFEFGELSWQCDSLRPMGINPAGCTRDGQSIDGVLPDDQRRSGAFTWPPPKENYVWEALQGALVQAAILHRAGYPAFQWGDSALLRAARWLHEEAGYPAQGDDTWQPHLLNHFYETDFPAPIPTSPGKNMGWTDWTHAPPPPAPICVGLPREFLTVPGCRDVRLRLQRRSTP
jgi:hypothetical protein